MDESKLGKIESIKTRCNNITDYVYNIEEDFISTYIPLSVINFPIITTIEIVYSCGSKLTWEAVNIEIKDIYKIKNEWKNSKIIDHEYTMYSPSKIVCGYMFQLCSMET
jgi:hypothetical protein